MERKILNQKFQAQGKASELGRNSKRVVELQPGVLCMEYFFGSTQRIRYSKNVVMPFNFYFNYINLGEYWEIDIVSLPDYRGRNKSAYIIHTMPSARGGKKICVSAGHEPRTEKQAKDLSVNWADLQIEYILTGKTPDEQIEENCRRKQARR